MNKLKQYGITAAINRFNSIDFPFSHRVSQGSILQPFLFLLYNNDLSTAIKFFKVHCFADDTNLQHKGNSVQKLNKFVNFDLKKLSNWLNANMV